MATKKTKAYSEAFRREAVRALDLMARMSAYYALADPGEVAPVFLAFSAAAQILAEQGDE